MTTSVVDNGVNVAALLGAREAFADAPEIARFQWRSSVTWANGTHSTAEVDTFFGFGEHRTAASSGTRRHSPSTSTTRCSSPPRTTASRPWSTCWSPSAAA